MDQNEMQAALGNKMQELLKNEQLFLLAAIGLFLLKYFHVPYAGILCTLGYSSLAVVYFFSAYTNMYEKDTSGLDIFLSKLTAFASATALVGILFALQRWPGSRIMVTLGASTLVLVLLSVLYQKSRRPEAKPFGNILFIRIFLLVAASALIFYLHMAK